MSPQRPMVVDQIVRQELQARVGVLVGPFGASAAITLEQVHTLATALLANAPAAVTAEFTVNTLRYYRRMGIVSSPDGQTISARYGRRHILEAAVARLSGHGSQGTIASMAERLPTLDDAALLDLLAVRFVEAQTSAQVPAVAERGVADARDTPRADPTGYVPAGPPWTVMLPGGAFCVFPSGHPVAPGPQQEAALTTLIAALSTALRTALAPATVAHPPARPLPR